MSYSELVVLNLGRDRRSSGFAPGVGSSDLIFLSIGRTFVPLFGRRPNRPLRWPRQEAKVRLAAPLSRRQAGTGGSGRTIVASSEVLFRAKAFAMLGALAWQARLEQAVPAKPLLFRPRRFAKVDLSFLCPRHIAEVRAS